MTEHHRHYFAETTFGSSKDAYYTMDRSDLIAVHCEGYASMDGKVGNVSPQFMARDILRSMKRTGRLMPE